MSFKAFLKGSAKLQENKKIALSERFKDEKGNTELWELKALSEKENSKIKESCISKSFFKGRQQTNFAGELYTLRICAASVIYPDLYSTELQESYGVVGQEDLLGVMLLPGEYSALSEAVQKLNGFDLEQMERDMDEVKNS
ncbi:MAG: phage portal protein [Hydrogenoanaerobacterium sp.]